MAIYKLPNSSQLQDAQYFTVQGPDGLYSGFQYNEETKTMYIKDSQIIYPSFHGITHISEDPVPDATIDSPGLMSADDKAKLESLVQTKLGVLGFNGAGYPDDGGWMEGPIIFASGSELLSIERLGNVVRFSVDSPIPLSCSCFEPGCPVLMADGTTKAIEEVRIGDKVVTHNGQTKKVLKTLESNYSGEMLDINVVGHNGKFSVTPGHPIYSYAEKINSRRTAAIRDKTGLILESAGEDWVLSQDLSEKDFVVKRFASKEEIDVDIIRWSDYYDHDYLIDNNKIYPARISKNGVVWKDGMAKGVPSNLELSNDLLDLFGYYLAEGCYSDKNGIRFTVHSDELKSGRIGSEIIRIIKNQFGIEPKIQRKPSCDNAVDIQFFSVIIGRIFKKWFGDRSNNKHVPEWILTLPPNKQYRIIYGLFVGDSSKRFGNCNIRLEISSKTLTNQIRWMSERCGLEFRSFSKRKPGGYNKFRHNRFEYDNLEFTATHNKKLFEDITGVIPQDPHIYNYLKTENEILHKIGSINKRYYSGKVYNFEIEDDHSYIVDGIVVHNCEECAQIYWIQDETEVAAIRPPSCAGKMPGVNAYGEMKIYLFPESTILDQNDPTATLSQKDQYPALIFKRYENNINYSGQLEMILRRNDDSTTNVGWSMTPGVQNTNVAECVWFTGNDTDGRTIRFEFKPEEDPGMLGALIYQGHTITKRMGVITGLDPTVVTTNRYKVKYWDIPNKQSIGNEFIATNVWRYENITTTPELVVDKTIKLHEVGRLVSLWEFNITNTTLVRRYFSDEPRLDPSILWTHTASVMFGDTLTSRKETDEPVAGGDTTMVSDIRNFENSQWGIVGFPDPLYYMANPGSDAVLEGPYNNLFSANIDYDLPGLHVTENEDLTEEIVDRYERPVYVWNRVNHSNFYMKMLVGQPDASFYPPIDILFRSPVDSFADTYVVINESGMVGSEYYIIVDGVNWNDVPKRGTIRFLTKSRNLVWKYQKKAMSNSSNGKLVLISEYPLPTTTEGIESDPNEMSIGVILHDDYDSYCCRLEFMVNNTTGSEAVQLQFKVGILDMDTEYDFDDPSETWDNLIKGFRPQSYSVSRWFVQDGFWSGPGTTVGDPVNFVTYPGGLVLGEESWNKLEIMCRNNQLWIWWNEMIVTPDPAENASISPAPVADISNPYFDLTGSDSHGIPAAPAMGKVGLRLWPGSKIRSVDIRDQAKSFNELSHGQLEIYS